MYANNFFLSLLFFCILSIQSCTNEEPTIVGYEYEIPSPVDNTWQVTSLAEAQINEEEIIDLTNAILSNEYTDIHSMLIIRNGKLAYENYFNGFSASQLHVLFSTTKSYASTLIGIAIDQNRISSVDEPLKTFFPEKEAFFIDGKEKITLKHLLNMSSGYEWDEWSSSTLDASNNHALMMASPSQIDYVLQLPVAHESGAVFTYSTGLSNLMAPIVEHATGSDIQNFAEEHLFEPLDIDNYRWNTAIDSYPSTGGSLGGLELTPRDMAKLGQLFLDKGTWKGERVISEQWVEEALLPRIRVDDRINYGYQWWNRTYFTKDGKSVDEFDAVGDGGQWVFVFPEYELVIAFTGGNYTWEKGGELMFQPVNMVQKYILPAIE